MNIYGTKARGLLLDTLSVSEFHSQFDKQLHITLPLELVPLFNNQDTLCAIRKAFLWEMLARDAQKNNLTFETLFCFQRAIELLTELMASQLPFDADQINKLTLFTHVT